MNKSPFTLKEYQQSTKTWFENKYGQNLNLKISQTTDNTLYNYFNVNFYSFANEYLNDCLTFKFLFKYNDRFTIMVLWGKLLMLFFQSFKSVLPPVLKAGSSGKIKLKIIFNHISFVKIILKPALERHHKVSLSCSILVHPIYGYHQVNVSNLLLLVV